MAVAIPAHSGMICCNRGQDLERGFEDEFCINCWQEDEDGHGFLHRWYIERQDCYDENAVHESVY